MSRARLFTNLVAGCPNGHCKTGSGSGVAQCVHGFTYSTVSALLVPINVIGPYGYGRALLSTPSKVIHKSDSLVRV